MPTVRLMEIGDWLRSLDLEQYEAAFKANAVDAGVLRDLTDQDLQKLGVVLGDRRKLLHRAKRRVSALRPMPLPISPETILAAAAAGASPQSRHGEDYSVLQPSRMSSRRRRAEMMGDPSLSNSERTTSWLTASDDRNGDDIQAAETGEAHGAHDYYDDLPTKHWRDRLVMAIAVIALGCLGAGGAFAYRAIFAEAALPALPPVIKAENTPNENLPNNGDNRPSDLSETSRASAGSSEEFVSRFPADNQEPPKTAPASPDPSPSPPRATVAPIATTPPAFAPPATSLPPKVVAPAPTPSSSTPKKIKTVTSRSEGSGKNDTSAATAKSPAAKPRAAAEAPPAGSQLAPDAAAKLPEAKSPAAAALPVGRPLSLAPDGHGHSAATPPPRSGMPAGTGTTTEASSGGSYEVAIASERSAADADAVFRSLQAKFPNQLGGREPIVRRTNLGPEGTYYRASIGPFASMKAAARVCGSLKAAGESCLVEKN